MLDELALIEQDKYRRMWAVQDYHNYSPGLVAAPAAAMFFNPQPGETIRDYGCGEPKAVDWFRRKGFACEGVDIYPARDDIREVTLWAMPEDLPATDYAFSCDVMEHLPTDKVVDAIKQLCARTRKAAYIQVYTANEGSDGWRLSFAGREGSTKSIRVHHRQLV